MKVVFPIPHSLLSSQTPCAVRAQEKDENSSHDSRICVISASIFQIEGRRLTGQGFNRWLCPNRLGDCYTSISLAILVTVVGAECGLNGLF